MDSKAGDITVVTIGIDISKNTFHLVGLDDRGAIVVSWFTFVRGLWA
jgi:hypothetical protein